MASITNTAKLSPEIILLRLGKENFDPPRNLTKINLLKMKKQLYKYEVQCWYRYGKDGDEKEFLTTTVIAESDEIAEKLAKETRRNIFSTTIKSKTPYVEPRF